MSKLALGTVQFGSEYGINNASGQVSREEVFAILSAALISGVATLDTARAYGQSEQIIGDYICQNGNRFKIVSKLSSCNASAARNIFLQSLKRLNIDSIYGYILHGFEIYQNNHDVWHVLEELKQDGLVNKIGFSLYYPKELDYILQQQLKIDLVQVPYSVFDQRFGKYFDKLSKMGVEIHVRSVFLQGLVFKKPKDLPDYFLNVRNKIILLNDLSNRCGISLANLCLGFALLNKNVNKVVLGVDTRDHFNEALNAQTCLQVMEGVYDQLTSLAEKDEEILIPSNWEKAGVLN